MGELKLHLSFVFVLHVFTSFLFVCLYEAVPLERRNIVFIKQKSKVIITTPHEHSEQRAGEMLLHAGQVWDKGEVFIFFFPF